MEKCILWLLFIATHINAAMEGAQLNQLNIQALNTLENCPLQPNSFATLYFGSCNWLYTEHQPNLICNPIEFINDFLKVNFTKLLVNETTHSPYEKYYAKSTDSYVYDYTFLSFYNVHKIYIIINNQTICNGSKIKTVKFDHNSAIHWNNFSDITLKNITASSVNISVFQSRKCEIKFEITGTVPHQCNVSEDISLYNDTHTICFMHYNNSRRYQLCHEETSITPIITSTATTDKATSAASTEKPDTSDTIDTTATTTSTATTDIAKSTDTIDTTATTASTATTYIAESTDRADTIDTTAITASTATTYIAESTDTADTIDTTAITNKTETSKSIFPTKISIGCTKPKNRTAKTPPPTTTGIANQTTSSIKTPITNEITMAINGSLIAPRKNSSENGTLCTCPCFVESTQDLAKRMQKIRKELIVNLNETSRYIAKKISATDNRPSSQAMGALAIAFLTILTAIIIIPDIITLIRFLFF